MNKFIISLILFILGTIGLASHAQAQFLPANDPNLAINDQGAATPSETKAPGTCLKCELKNATSKGRYYKPGNDPTSDNKNLLETTEATGAQ